MKKTAIIIGATSGLGRGVAESLAAEGWQLGIAGRRVEALEELRDKFGSERISIAQMDVTESGCTEALDRLIAMTGAPDLLLYVSGVGYQNLALDEEKEIRTVMTNSVGMVRIVDHFVNYVRANDSIYNRHHKAHIAVVTSVAGTAGMGSAPAYSATKKMCSTYITALVQLKNMEKLPISFSDIRPGFVRTDILDANKHYPMIMSREKAVKHILYALRKRKRVYIFDWRFRLMVAVWKLTPRFIWERNTLVKS